MAKYYSETSPAWAGVQTGTIAMMPKDSGGNYYAPDGWLECNGRGLNPNEYVGLYNVIENTYGGTTTGTFPNLSGDFNVPDLRDRRVVGTGRLRPDNTSPQLEQHDAGSTNNCGTRGGKNNITLKSFTNDNYLNKKEKNPLINLNHALSDKEFFLEIKKLQKSSTWL